MPSGLPSASAAAPSASASSYVNLAYPCPQGDLAYDIGVAQFPDVDFNTGLQNLVGAWLEAFLLG
jgi:hypothetical protein